MTKKEAVKIFERDYLGAIPVRDTAALNLHWNNFTDHLCKSNQITSSQYNNWLAPSFSKAHWLSVRSKYVIENVNCFA